MSINNKIDISLVFKSILKTSKPWDDINFIIRAYQFVTQLWADSSVIYISRISDFAVLYKSQYHNLGYKYLWGPNTL